MIESTNNGQLELLHPEVWSLALHVQNSCLRYVLYSTVEDNSLTFGTLPFSTDTSDRVRSLEAAVYDNPFLLSQFGKITIVVDSDRFILVPDEMSGGDADEIARYYKSVYPDDGRNLQIDNIPDAAMSLVCGLEPEIDSFVRRTFYNPPMVHCLTPMIRYFRKKDAYGGRNKMFVYASDRTLEIVALKNGKPVFANWFSHSGVDDAFYHVANAWRHCRMDSETDEMHIAGEKALKSELIARLRRSVRNVVQVIFPAEMLRLGKDVMSAPFDLIILPLCE